VLQDTFISHLVELRERLMRMLLAVFVVLAGLLIWPGSGPIYDFLALPIVVGSTLLFFLGVAFCYYFVFGRVFHFILEFAPKSISVAPDIENYLNFVITMFIAFGVTFEIPVAVVLLVRSGIVSAEKLAEARSYVILGSAFVAAVITPPDAVSMLALFVPMLILFEAGLLVSRFVGGRQKEVESPPSPIDPTGNTP